MTHIEYWRLLKWWLIHAGPRRDITVQAFNGLLTFENKNWLIGKYLYVRRCHEEQELKAAVDLLNAEQLLDRPASKCTVLNVGANIGMTCIGLTRAGFFGKAIAFEPAPENFRLLLRNIQQNGLQDRIEAFPLALTADTGQLTFELSQDNSGDHRVRQTVRPGFFREEKRRTIMVPGETLDNFSESESKTADAIWVDIQGHEAHFFQGARKFLAKGTPVIAEFWPYGLERAGTSQADFCRLVSELFSHFWVIGNNEFRRTRIADIGRLFELYPGPRNFGLILLN